MREFLRLSTFHAGTGSNQQIIYQPLFDSARIEGGPLYKEFFNSPLGQDGKTPEDTNMMVPNQLVYGNDFYMTNVQVYFVPNVDRIDYLNNQAEVLHVLGNGRLVLQVCNRRYLDIAPLAALVPEFPMYWARDDKVLLDYMTKPDSVIEGEGVQKNKPFGITPLYINSGQPISVTVSITKSFKLVSVGKLGVMLGGYIIREES